MLAQIVVGRQCRQPVRYDCAAAEAAVKNVDREFSAALPKKDHGLDAERGQDHVDGWNVEHEETTACEKYNARGQDT